MKFYQLTGKVLIANTWFEVTCEVSDEEVTISDISILGAERDGSHGKPFDISSAAVLFVRRGTQFVSLYQYFLDEVAPRVPA